MNIKKYSIAWITLALLLTNISYAQTGNTDKQQKISNLKEVIRTSSDAAEVAKAERLLEELQGGAQNSNTVVTTPNVVLPTPPQRTQQQIDLEEQKHASETLSPAEYAIWKAHKTSQQNSGQQSPQ